MSRAAALLGLLLGALAALASAGCGLPAPEPLVRVSGWSPQGSAVPLDAEPRVEFSGAVAPPAADLPFPLVLCRSTDAHAVTSALEAGRDPGPLAVPAETVLAADGRWLALRPRAPLGAGRDWTLLLAATLHDAQGMPVLDPGGHRRTFAATFRTVAGPPPRPVVTELRAVASAPQAGGEYVELLNLGAGPIDLSGWRLEKRTASGTPAGCTIATSSLTVAPGAFALVTGGAWDGRYAVPAGVARFTCGASALAGGLADDRPPEIWLLDPSGAAASSLGAGGTAVRCPAALERIDPAGPDGPANLACADGEGTPGACNSVTPVGSCR